MRKPVILHIDDDADVREVTRDLLSNAGMDVRVARNVAEGIQSALEITPDLLLLDLHMPDGDGFEACVAFRALGPLQNVPIILLSSMAEEGVSAPCLTAPPPTASSFATLIATIKKSLPKW